MNEWQYEPNEVHWLSDYDYNCLILRNSVLLHLCGYVEVPASHPFFGKGYDDIPVNCHGGLTYSAERHPLQTGDEKSWWIGFDCAHLDDCSPGTPYTRGGVYRNLAYVKAQCESISNQMKEYENEEA